MAESKERRKKKRWQRLGKQDETKIEDIEGQARKDEKQKVCMKGRDYGLTIKGHSRLPFE